MKSIKKLLRSTIELIITFSRDAVNYITDGISERNGKKVALNLALLLSVVVLVVLAVALFVKLVTENLPKIIAAGFLAAAAYSALSKLFQTEEPTPPPQPHPTSPPRRITKPSSSRSSPPWLPWPRLSVWPLSMNTPTLQQTRRSRFCPGAKSGA